MSKKRRKSKSSFKRKPMSYVSPLAYQTGHGFRWAAEEGIAFISKACISEDFSKQILENRGITIATAINLSLAAELAIKSMLSAYECGVPQHHNLYELFTGLPPELKRDLSAEAARRMNDTISHVIYLGRNPSVDSPKLSADPLEDALMSSSGTLDDFRFIYELDDKKTGYQVDFHFTGLLMSVDVLLLIAKEIFSKMYGVEVSQGIAPVNSRFRFKHPNNAESISTAALTIEAASRLSDPAFSFNSRHKNSLVGLQPKFAAKNNSLLPASVVGATLAIEMCFKSMARVLEKPYDKEGHSLKKNFNNLTESAQQLLRKEFDQQMKIEGEHFTHSFAFSDTKEKLNEGVEKKHAIVQGTELIDILDVSSFAFVKWRYLYEFDANSDEIVYHEISLGCVCNLAFAAIATSVRVINNPSEFL